MQQFFVNLNRYMAGRKVLFISLLVLVLLGVTYTASRIRLEENLNAIIPEDKRISNIGMAFDNSELSDQLVFILSLKDSSLNNPALLISEAEKLVNKLLLDSSLVEGIRFRFDNKNMIQAYDFIYDHLPLFLEEEDYIKMEAMLMEEELEEIIRNDFKSLLSPAGLATRDFILKDPLSLTAIALQKLEKFRLDDNFTIYNSVIFTRDRKHLLFFLDPVHPSSETRKNKILVDFVEEAVDNSMKDQEDILVQYYGGTAVAVANSVRVKKDIRLTLSIALILFLVIFLTFFKRFRVMLLVFVPVILGALFSMAMLALIYGKVSAIALGVGVIFIGITLDYSLHLFTHLQSEGSLAETLKRITLPVIMSSLTTASAFLCLYIVRAEAMNQIGLFAAFAVVASALSVLIVTPLLISGWKKRTRKNNPGRGFAEKLVGYSFEKNRILIYVILGLTVLFIFTSMRIRFNGDISSLNFQTRKLDEAEQTLKSISSVANSSVYLITQDQSLEGAIEKLERSNPLFRQCQDNGLLTEVSAASDLIPSRNVQLDKISKWDQFWEKQDRQKVVKKIIDQGKKWHFREDAFSTFYALVEKNFLPVPVDSFDHIRELFLDNYISQKEGTYSLITIIKASPQRKDELFNELSVGEDLIIFDTQYFINQFFDILKKDFNLLALVSMIVVFLILLIFFGRIEIAIITFIPIIISWIWALGLMGLFDIEINIFNIIISTFVFGLGIDYCIFIMNGILANYREGKHSLTPYKVSILLSSLTTIAGIGVLIFARHPALRSIAVVSIFGISSVVLIAYTLLPLLFSFLTRGRGKNRISPVTLSRFLGTLMTFTLFLICALIATLMLPVLVILPIGRKYKKAFIHHIMYLFSRFIVAVGFFIRKQYINTDLLDFSKPAVIIANHQSQLDLVMMMRLHPKLVILVNEWVWKNPFYGPIIRFAGFYPVYKGLDHNFEALKKKVEEGYSILAFPEGSRSPDGTIKRFHQGALGIADSLGLQVQPVLIHGAFHCFPKTELFMRKGKITMKYFPRLNVQPTDYGEMKSYRDQTKALTSFYRDEYSKLCTEVERPEYFKKLLIGKFLYKGPVLEWYLRVKIKLEKNYSFFNDLIPREAEILDLGCGYGFLSLMLGMVSEKRKITGIDYDENKIALAKQIAVEMPGIEFKQMDITELDIPSADVYVLNDVLHYLPFPLQWNVLEKCMARMKKGGRIIIREADADLEKRTSYTRWTEIMSTRIFRFNMTRNKLDFMKGSQLKSFVMEKGFHMRSFDRTKYTSNISHLITKNEVEDA